MSAWNARDVQPVSEMFSSRSGALRARLGDGQSGTLKQDGQVRQRNVRDARTRTAVGCASGQRTACSKARPR